MSKERVKVVRLYLEKDDKLHDLKHEFELDALCDTVPCVGDLLVDPTVLRGDDRTDPDSRWILEVVGRYFLPGAHGPLLSYVALVVSPRPGTEREAEITSIS